MLVFKSVRLYKVCFLTASCQIVIIKTYLMEVIDPRGVLRVDMVGDIAMGLPWDEPIGPGGKADVGVS